MFRLKFTPFFMTLSLAEVKFKNLDIYSGLSSLRQFYLLFQTAPYFKGNFQPLLYSTELVLVSLCIFFVSAGSFVCLFVCFILFFKRGWSCEDLLWTQACPKIKPAFCAKQSLQYVQFLFCVFIVLSGNRGNTEKFCNPLGDKYMQKTYKGGLKSSR